MNKFLAVVKREYLYRVRSKMFVLMTILGPVMLAVFTIVPGLLFSIKTADTRMAIVDLTEGKKLFKPVRDALLQQDDGERSNYSGQVASSVNANARSRLQKAGKTLRGSFSVEDVELNGRTLPQIKQELNARISQEQLDAYLVLPADVLKNSESKPTYFGRNVGDVITSEQIEDRLNRAITRQRFIENGVKEEYIEALSRPVDLETHAINGRGEEGVKDSGAGFILVFVVAFLIYITVLMYGQVILGAIVEEKETRIAEILFSSVKSFTLMVGKLIGVSFVAVTQLGIWTIAFGVLSAYGVSALQTRGYDVAIPRLPVPFFVYFFLFFVAGYFIYASIYVLIGSMVTTTQEGGQLAMPVVFLLMSGLYMAFPVIRGPNSAFAFWVSMFPLFSPITMVVRIVSQTPPTWQILLSLCLAAGTALLFIWLASRIYRIGMLMYGKKATIPEVIRWAREG